MRVPAFLSVIGLLVLCAVAACPTGWTSLNWDTTCSAIWPRVYTAEDTANGRSYTDAKARNLSMPMNFNRAVDFCSQQNASLPTITDLAIQLKFYKDLMGLQSGRSFWVNAWRVNAPTSTQWVTDNHRSDGLVFDWDTARAMPRTNDNCIAVHMKGDGSLVHGGNERMIGTDCGALHHVICTKKEIAAGIGAVNGGDPRRLEFIWGVSNLDLTFYGPRIPTGTLLTLQTGDNLGNPARYRIPTRCESVTTIAGPSAPFALDIVSGVTVDAALAAKYCGGGTTCDQAKATIPSTWPFQRGAKYSLCFFVADTFPSPVTLEEYRNELLGEEMVLDVVQQYSTYLEDICEARTNDIATFYDGYADVNAAPRTIYPFDSAIEDSKDSLLSFETLNPPPGYGNV